MNVSKVRIGAIHNQGSRPMAYFSEWLSGSKLNYNTYGLQFYGDSSFEVGEFLFSLQ